MKPTQALFRRLRKFQMSRKAGPRGYYRGTGTGKMGEHTSKGGYIINYDLVRSYVAPEGLKEFKLTPFVARRIKPMKEVNNQYSYGKGTPQQFLEQWKETNGMD